MPRADRSGGFGVVPRRASRAIAVVGATLVALTSASCASPAEQKAAPSAVAPSGSPAPTAGSSPGVPPAAAAVVAEPSVPVAVRIPAIDVSSELIDLGIAADGALETPQDYALAGWFTGGGRPGSTGPTVIAGHVDSVDGPAVFFDLEDLEPGDVVEVDVADGTTARYEVTGTERYPKDEFPSFAVFGATPADELHLVTCTGDFDAAERNYLDNLVVSARRI